MEDFEKVQAVITDLHPDIKNCIRTAEVNEFTKRVTLSCVTDSDNQIFVPSIDQVRVNFKTPWVIIDDKEWNVFEYNCRISDSVTIATKTKLPF